MYVNYKVALSSLATIVGIALAIIGLSLQHQHELVKLTATKSVAAVEQKQAASNDKQIVSGGLCNIERIDGDIFSGNARRSRALPIELTGWIVDPLTKSVPSAAEIRIEQITTQNVWVFPLLTNINRPDVAAGQGEHPGYLTSGFSINLDTAGLPDGNYRLAIQYQSGGKVKICDNGGKLQLVD